MSILPLIAASALILIAAIALTLLERKNVFNGWSNRAKHVIVGLLFGMLAIFSTESGANFEGAIINVRDAAALTAGLVFSGPAGIIAGLIGGIHRWLAVYWGGAGEYTVFACTFSTIVAGFVGAGVRKWLFDNRKGSVVFVFIIALCVEVFHMLMIFVSHMNQVYEAFRFVEKVTLPMVAANTICVTLAVYLSHKLGGQAVKPLQDSEGLEKIEQTVQRWLLVAVVTAFLATCLFTSVLQQHIVTAATDAQLRVNLNDLQNDVSDVIDEELLINTRAIARNLPDETQALRALMYYHSVSEINVVDENGIIVLSTEADNMGFDMSSGEQSREFMRLLDSGVGEYVQAYRPITRDPSVSRKYAAVTLSGGGFLQVGYNAERFQQAGKSRLRAAARNRHIGETGAAVICDADWNVIASRIGYEGSKWSDLMSGWLSDTQEDVMFRTDIDGVSCYCMYHFFEGYTFIALEPASEALFMRNVSSYVLAFLEIIVFAALFCMIYFLLKRLVLENLQKINQRLGRITGGDLSVVMDVRSNVEFADLSDGINSTVDTLKRYISEAERRIDKELEFAKLIQHSALPAVTPMIAERKEFEIWGRMDTAKEVGGDFYDFYFLGENELVILIADVSGKGIPAAMFMMTSKTLLKSLTETRMNVDEVFTNANDRLCASNEAGMFVTVWMGVLNLDTGLMRYANAGHNFPLLRRQDQSFEFLKCKPNLVLSSMEGIRYRVNEVQMNPGDTLYLYTDGVTEAVDLDNQQYGDQRLQDALNRFRGGTMEELCEFIKKDVDVFVGKAAQFDDMTMLALKLNDLKHGGEVCLPNGPEAADKLEGLLDEFVEEYEIPMACGNRIQIVADEIMTNIANYSEAKNVTVTWRKLGSDVLLLFRDDGVPYDPLTAQTPDTESSLEDRQIGGLGIFMVRKLAQSVEYARADDQNQLLVRLRTE